MGRECQPLLPRTVPEPRSARWSDLKPLKGPEPWATACVCVARDVTGLAGSSGHSQFGMMGVFGGQRAALAKNSSWGMGIPMGQSEQWAPQGLWGNARPMARWQEWQRGASEGAQGLGNTHSCLCDSVTVLKEHEVWVTGLPLRGAWLSPAQEKEEDMLPILGSFVPFEFSTINLYKLCKIILK